MREILNRKISVIIPVHNAEKYLEKAVQSIRLQSYADWEMILIESGSEDASLELCRKLAGKDQKIQVIEEKNRGIGAARNTGLRNAAGEYIVFVDADDYLPDPDVFQRYINIAEQIETDIIVSNYVRLWNGKILSATGHDVFSIYSPNSEEFRFRGFFSVGTLSYVWGKLYRKSFLEEKNIVFSDFEYAEDKLFNMQCYICGARYAFLKECGYVYRKNDNSISFQYHKNSSKCWIGIADTVRQWIEKEEDPEVYMGLVYYTIFFAAFFDGKMEYTAKKNSLRAVRRILKIYGRDTLGRESFQKLFSDKRFLQLQQPVWKIMIRGFSMGMKFQRYFLLAMGIKLLIDFRVDERLSDTGLREQQ